VSSPVAPRGAKKRRKVVHPPQPRTPEDFFSAQAQEVLADLLKRRAARWQADSLPPLYFYRRDSEPLWGEEARRRCSGTTLRIAGKRVLFESVSMDLERGLRLLTLPWTPQGTTADGHTSAEWRAALAGVRWRIGQHYREFARRMGETRACELLRQVMDTLWT
jgi:hypothetical protein